MPLRNRRKARKQKRRKKREKRERRVEYEEYRNALKSEVRKAMITSKGNASPIAVRLAWHSSGTYNASTGQYGNNGATMRFEPEISDEANAGLDIMRRIIAPVVENHPELSTGDIWSFAGKCAVEFTGGPEIPHHFGRTDAADGSACPAHGFLPDAKQGAQHLRDVFYRMGFDDRAIVCLSGAHTLGKCNTSRSGFEGYWTLNHRTFDNSYFTNLLNNKWIKHTQPNGNEQYHDEATGQLMMLESDLCIKTDPVFRKVTEEYAANERIFFKDFAKYFGKMLGNGVPKSKL